VQNTPNIILVLYSQSGRNIDKNKGAKVFPKIKNGQKKCPIFKSADIL
jgi:hypothetical protein